MANLLDTCPTCFEITLNECADFIVIEGGFIVFEDYVIIITDKFGHEYRLNVTAGYDGELTIDVTDLPDGLFTAHSGVFTVIIYGEDGCTPVDITLCDVYTCLKLSFKSVYDANAPETITETIKCCEEAESIIFNLVTFTCNDPADGSGIISGTFSVINGSGNYGLQTFVADTWVTQQTVTETFNFETGGNDVTVNTRIIDIDTGIFSNEIELTITTCIADSIILNSITQLCNYETNPATGVNIIYNADVVGGSGNYTYQYSTDGITWIDAAVNPPGKPTDGSINYLVAFDQPEINYQFRVIDNINSLVSNIVNYEVQQCSDLIFNSIISDEHISFSATNIYEVGNLWGAVAPDDVLNLGMELSTDGGNTWSPMAVRRILTSTPFTGTEPDTFWNSVSFVDTFFYRLVGKNVNGDIIYSNAIQYLIP